MATPTTITKRVPSGTTADNTNRLDASALTETTTKRVPPIVITDAFCNLLYEADLGSVRILLEGDATSGDCVLILDGDAVDTSLVALNTIRIDDAAITETTTKRVASGVTASQTKRVPSF